MAGRGQSGFLAVMVCGSVRLWTLLFCGRLWHGKAGQGSDRRGKAWNFFSNRGQLPVRFQ
jgi:hypothetical protein